MVFIDASAYLALLLPEDSNRDKAIDILNYISPEEGLITSYPVLGEILTVASQRYSRQAAIDFVKRILKSKTKVVVEDYNLVEESFKLFQQIKKKDVSWVDCLSFVIIERDRIGSFFSFDKDFKKFAKAKSLT